jgi:hypothetical protein
LNVLPDAELLAVDAAHCSACPKKLTCHQNVSTPLVFDPFARPMPARADFSRHAPTARLILSLGMFVTVATSTPVFPDAFTTVVLDETGDYHRVFWDGEGARARVFHGVDNFNDVFVCNQTRRELTHYSINASGRCDVQVSSVSECLAAIRTELLNHGLQLATLVDGVSPFAQRVANDSGCAPMPAPAYPISASNCDRSCHHWRSTSDAPCGLKGPCAAVQHRLVPVRGDGSRVTAECCPSPTLGLGRCRPARVRTCRHQLLLLRHGSGQPRQRGC